MRDAPITVGCTLLCADEKEEGDVDKSSSRSARKKENSSAIRSALFAGPTNLGRDWEQAPMLSCRRAIVSDASGFYPCGRGKAPFFQSMYHSSTCVPDDWIASNTFWRLVAISKQLHAFGFAIPSGPRAYIVGLLS